MLKCAEIIQNTTNNKHHKIILGYDDKDSIPFQDIP
jgi:hypothetical protein